MVFVARPICQSSVPCSVQSLPRIEALTSVGWVSWPSFSGHSLTLPKLALEVLGPTTCSL